MVNKNSILSSIKKLLLIDEADTSFDMDITMHINAAFFHLNQLGVGPVGGYSIDDKFDLWSDFLGSAINLEGVKTFVFLKVRLSFDPPSMGYLVKAIEDQIKELEWRLNVQVENNE
jgi:hypothetical protein